jgi:Mlc titration factor MtfA (ptsG expression regulator)
VLFLFSKHRFEGMMKLVCLSEVTNFFSLEYIVIIVVAIICVMLLFSRVIEPGYVTIFNKPLYIHFYLFPKKLTPSQKHILKNEFVFYKRLSRQRKRYFEHRVATFIAEYEFVPKENLVITDQMKVLIGATSTMLTFGMKDYLYDVFNTIIIYPESYYSTVNDTYHKGEFNPRMRVLVFSWKDFLEGYSIDNDNVNLGLHEFAHALNFQELKSNTTTSAIFTDMFREILEAVNHPANTKRLVDSEYFRIYAYTNKFEFLAVILEHFFETPQIFKKEFPELFEKVRTMINYTDK